MDMSGRQQRVFGLLLSSTFLAKSGLLIGTSRSGIGRLSVLPNTYCDKEMLLGAHWQADFTEGSVLAPSTALCSHVEQVSPAPPRT